MHRGVKQVAILITDGFPTFNGPDAYQGALDAANDGIEIFVFGKCNVILEAVAYIIFIVIKWGGGLRK